ncbi:hypothetical protein [Nocardia cyriacigeorgica]|uniref:hypothetical protein n=1 Tax=Nocardia cyriacigeorgica TaxID=135487 RepID=UPI00189443EB|nr:hypothetical protein [Nocardia cyriacigeorgica]MBF6513583.1 hypothetical protein [Nocardia cyriacigeorgica]
MKILSSRWHCFEYTPVDPGPCAVELAPASVALARTFHDCLLLHIYVEPGERGPSGEVVRAIQAMIAQSAAAYVVINGSPVLPSGAGRAAMSGPDLLAHLADTLDLVEEIAERLEERGERVHLMPFGWHLECGRACAFAGPCDVVRVGEPAQLRRRMPEPAVLPTTFTTFGSTRAKPSGWATMHLIPPRRQPIGPSTRSR